jgi:hypothetical protein
MTHLSDKALLVNLSIKQWTAKKLDKRASVEIAKIHGADSRAGRYNKSLLPTCTSLAAVHQETTVIRTEFYHNTLPWGIEGTFILPSANYLPFMTEYRGKKGTWEHLTMTFFGEYEQGVLDAERLLGSLFKASDYPSQDEMELKFSMDLSILPVPSAGDFRVELADDEVEHITAEIEQSVADSSAAAVKDIWQRLFDKVSWLHGRLADPKTTFHDETYQDAKDLVGMLARLNFTDDPELETLRSEAEQKLFNVHPQSLRNDPILRTDTAAEAKAIADKMAVFMGGMK